MKDTDGTSKGFGFVCYERPEDAESAFKAMQNKTIWSELPPIYVNFAMTKSERVEHLQKKREETYRLAQKMTVFAKVKDELAIQGENDFKLHLKNYLRLIFAKEYEPRSIKLKFETKSAFITMNSQKDAEDFIRKYTEYAKDHPTSLFFNLYKSKVDRITANSYFKKYNNFNAEGQIMDPTAKVGRYRKYNEGFNGQPQDHINRYNNFEDGMSQMSSGMPIRNYVSYNNFPANISNMTQKVEPKIQTQKPSIDPQDEDAIGEYLYSFAERLYPEYTIIY